VNATGQLQIHITARGVPFIQATIHLYNYNNLQIY